MKHLARVLLLCVAGCVAGGDGSPSPAASARSTPFRIDRLDHAADGKPYFVHGTLGTARAPIQTLADVDFALSAALPEIARSIAVPANQLFATRVSHDDIGMTHVIYEQRANDLPVVGGRIAVHVADDGTIVGVTNSARDVSALPLAPSIVASYAAETARNETAKGAATAGATDLVYVITNADGEVHLAWQVDVRAQHALVHDLVFVDAVTGDVVTRHPLIQPVKNRAIYTGGGGVYPGVFPTQIGTEATPPTEATGLLAFTNTGITYDAYHDLFQRDSYDNAGAELDSIVHVVFDNGQGGTNGDNAFWDGQEMVYGDGDGTEFGNFARALDVTAHELTHAVTEATAGLVYQDESGALNEASSDIMGAVVEEHHAGAVSANTWLVGEDVYTPNTPGDALRYMSNPTLDAPIYNNQYSSADYYPERFMQSLDNGGVHFNSGIANLAFYLLSQGGMHPRNKTPYTAIGIGIDKAGAIWERALTQGYFMPNTTFAQARTATEQAAQDLYPGTAKTAVSLAWATVGVGSAPTDTVPPTVHITSPMTGTSVQPGFQVAATATDDQGVLRVDFSVDGVVVNATTTAPYMFTTAATLAPGSHVIAATAYDAVNHASDSVTVTIIDPTCGNACTANQTCDAMTGTCVANPDTNTGDSGGCCSSSRGNAGGSLLLFAATGIVLLRRRRR
ncbi:MAG TPA: M4 family metallopeptidase [Kofleriaceae bacterium]|nr:M4 family metallopeptidase [Kofleriaceae bacterium]